MMTKPMPTQKDTLDFVRVRWPQHVHVQARLNKLGEEYGEVVGAFVKMSDGTGRKRVSDLAQETAQMVICAMALAEAAGFDLNAEIADEWERANRRVWPGQADDTANECAICGQREQLVGIQGEWYCAAHAAEGMAAKIGTPLSMIRASLANAELVDTTGADHDRVCFNRSLEQPDGTRKCPVCGRVWELDPNGF